VRLEHMLAAMPFVAETFSFQISSGRLVTPAGTIAAFEAWFERTFPDLRLPAVCFKGFSEEVDSFDSLDWATLQEGLGSLEPLPGRVDDVVALVA
jgi:hypothetical protein